MVYKWLDIARKLPYKRYCRLCLAPCQGKFELCHPCLDDLPRICHSCQSCARPLPEHAGNICGKCLKAPPPVTHCIALYTYQYPIDLLIKHIKFRNDLALINSMGHLLAHKITTTISEKPDLILPVPLHRKRLFERGYNQSIELARPIHSATGISAKPRICQRIIHTKAQSLLPASERRKNIRGVFKIAQEIDGMHIVIVDDVMTTGSTIYEIANTLLAAGASRVDAWVLARGID